MTPRVVVGGVGHLYQGDLDLGRVAVDLLRREELPDDVVVEEFSYGAVAVAQQLQDLKPDVLVLLGATERGREPGTVERRDVRPLATQPRETQRAIVDAVSGYIDFDLVLEVAHGLDALPPRVVAIEVEPLSTAPSEELTPCARVALERALELVRREVGAASAA